MKNYLWAVAFWLISTMTAADWVTDNNNVVLNGYDLVAYFTMDEAVKGSKNYTYDWKGKTFWFSSKEHQALFNANPEKYAPQFNGHCANGLSDGHVVDGNPIYWRVIDDKLYVFYSYWGRTQWAFNVEEQVELAWATFNAHDRGEH